jgi:hypothetical protein
MIETGLGLLLAAFACIFIFGIPILVFFALVRYLRKRE